MFERILIANRGEVATRVARTCRRVGIETVGLHLESERDALHVAACDEHVSLGTDPNAWDDTARLLEIAKEKGVHAVHPGYGALAEEPGFARAVTEQGLVLVGPDADCLWKVADRLAARAAAADAGVRVLPASERPIMGPQDALADVDRIDYPVVLRPARGLGDIHGRVCHDVADLAEALAELDPLGERGGAYVERHVERARHVEVQLIVDEEGPFVFGDREVSMRRGGRRMLCEAPAPALDQLRDGAAKRGAMWDAAAEAGARLACRGLGSCHFVLDDEGLFYFVEYAPGLQVEHTTTEMCTGVDLVELQLRLAAGEPIRDELAKIEPSGSALQARVDAATDPDTGRPFESQVLGARWPPAPQGKVRIESGVSKGTRIYEALDPLVATVTTYAPNRHDALLMLDRILAEIHLNPLVTNQPLLRTALNHESLRAGQYDDEFVDRL